MYVRIVFKLRVYECTGLVRCGVFLFQAEDGIRDLVRSRGLGDVYKRQMLGQPVYFLTPDVVGFELTGRLREGCTATDLVLTLSLIHI